jgi:hypothetical protein
MRVRERLIPATPGFDVPGGLWYGARVLERSWARVLCDVAVAAMPHILTLRKEPD